jgi:hypothetical protein
MSGGGIIIQRAKVLLVAMTDPCMYGYLSPTDKAGVDAIDAKDPMSRTQADIDTLYYILGRVKGC